MEEKMAFGKFIAKKRKENNLTQKELADKLYVTESAVSKWERGVSYPDISLVAGICEVLKISEHELITASEDLHQRELEKQARRFGRIKTSFKWSFYIIYGLSLLICFICNLAIEHTLSWFFIVLTAEATAFSLTSLPQIFDKNRWIITISVFFVSLNLLLLTCAIYTGGDWFLLVLTALLFSFAVVFLPYFLTNIEVMQAIYSNKALTCFSVDTVLLFLLLFVCSIYQNYIGSFLTVVCPVALISIILPWSMLIIIRYVRINNMFKTSVGLALSAIYVLFINSVLAVIIENKAFSLVAFNYGSWTEKYINGNIIMIIAAAFLIAAIIFAAGGVMKNVKRQIV